MNNEMNDLGLKISKYDILNGIVISSIILYVFSFNHAMVYLLGVIIAIINFLLTIYAHKTWFIKNNFLLVISTICRITLISIIIVPFSGETTLVVTYAAGFTSHFANLIYCTISRKGSA